MNPKVSVIVPVYNGEDTISTMVDSLLNQTLRDIEILIIDDGSTDKTPDILDSYSKKDKRIRVFHKVNEGVAMARQLGVNKAIADYSIHADADDWVENNMLEEMYNLAIKEDADILIADYYNDFKSGKTYYKKQNIKSLKSSDILKGILQGRLFGGLCHKLVRHSLYKDYNVSFFKDINYCEDVLVCAQLLKNDGVKVSYLPKAFYHYIQNDASITHHISRKSFEGLLKYKAKLNEVLDNQNYSSSLKSVELMIFHEGFCSPGVMSSREIKEYFKAIENEAFKTPSLRWKVGYYCVKLGLFRMARLLLNY